ncbi:MAG TPA: PsiF family protein [Burkholderiales bacterium]|nr:PsiF family protein [Burkholderiales bacterium]
MGAVALGMLFGRVAVAAAAATQQDRMATCNEQAGKKQLKGGERKTFMSKRLSSKM